jgi:hypothetical protein
MAFFEYPVTRPIRMGKWGVWLFWVIAAIFLVFITLLNVISVGYETTLISLNNPLARTKLWYEQLPLATWLQPPPVTCNPVQLAFQQGFPLP